MNWVAPLYKCPDSLLCSAPARRTRPITFHCCVARLPPPTGDTHGQGQQRQRLSRLSQRSHICPMEPRSNCACSKVAIRKRSLAFARSLPHDDLLFLRMDITEQATVDDWIRNVEHGDTAAPVIAEAGGEIVGYASVHSGSGALDAARRRNPRAGRRGLSRRRPKRSNRLKSSGLGSCADSRRMGRDDDTRSGGRACRLRKAGLPS